LVKKFGSWEINLEKQDGRLDLKLAMNITYNQSIDVFIQKPKQGNASKCNPIKTTPWKLHTHIYIYIYIYTNVLIF